MITPVLIIGCIFLKHDVSLEEQEVLQYIKSHYNNQLNIVSTDFQFEEFPNILTVSVIDKQQHSYLLYYDSTNHLCLFDEYAIKQSIRHKKQVFTPLLENHHQFPLNKKSSFQKAISVEESIIGFYEQLIEKETALLSTVHSNDELTFRKLKIVYLQQQLEKEYQYVGELYNQFDKLVK